MKGGFKESPLKLNAGLGQLDAWNEDAIQERAGQAGRSGARRLGRAEARCRDVWPPISRKAPATGGYTIDDHPHLLTAGHARGVRGVPQGGARARSLRERGVPEAVRGLQGRDQLRGRGAAGQAAAAYRST